MSKKIHTRAGDKGVTGLVSGERISKDDPCVEAYGTVDELIAVLGVAKVHSSSKVADYIREIQQSLFYVSSELAMKYKSLSPEDEALRNLRKINARDVELLEKIIDELSDELPPLNNFVIPGGTKAAAFLHMCRTVCRRAERRIIVFAKTRPVNEQIIRYINRLSDLLFVFSRYENIEMGDGDQIMSRESVTKMTKK